MSGTNASEYSAAIFTRPKQIYFAPELNNLGSSFGNEADIVRVITVGNIRSNYTLLLAYEVKTVGNIRSSYTFLFVY